MHDLDALRAGALAGTRRLRLSCGLHTFPTDIFTLADTLEVLDLSGNALSSLPDDLPRLHRLRILFCSDNQFTELPAVLGRCPQLSMVGFKANRIHTVTAQALPAALRWLILTDNQLETLPAELGHCQQLQKLMLAGNRLRSLPSLAACTRLELLRIAANQLEALPDGLLQLPRLTWLAFAGNPLTQAAESRTVQQSPLRAIPWSRLERQHTLGEGASGVIHQALWDDDGHARAVAVKLFKGAVTSDGRPDSEMAACLRAGSHPSLIDIHGRVAQHPEGAQGLVMALIRPDYSILAGPPSLASCTRDVYEDGVRLDAAATLRMASDMASVAAQLHRQGLMHGDLYAHNILRHASGHALLGDFGAASLLDGLPKAQALAVQRLEVRAWACLLEELLAHSVPASFAPGVLEGLSRLQMQCAQAAPDRRPGFDEVLQRLSSPVPA